jgi:hypothetical protein
MDSPWFRLVLAILATWRVTHLLAYEDGPGDVLVKLRTHVGTGFLAQLMDCFQCLSLWVAAPLAFAVARGPLEWALVWLALSGGACVLERLTREPVRIQELPPLKGEHDGVLWPEASGRTESTSEEHPAGHPRNGGKTDPGR